MFLVINDLSAADLDLAELSDLKKRTSQGPGVCLEMLEIFLS